MPRRVMVRLPTPTGNAHAPTEPGTGRDRIRAQPVEGRRHRPGRRRPSTAPAAALTVFTGGLFAFHGLDQADTNTTQAALCAAIAVALVAGAAALIALDPHPREEP